MLDTGLRPPTTYDLRPEAFFDLEGVQHAELFERATFVWEALEKLPRYVSQFFDRVRDEALSSSRLCPVDLDRQWIKGKPRLVLAPPGYEFPDDVWVDGELVIEEGVEIGPFCRIAGKNYLASRATLESHVVLSGNNLVGAGCHLKPSTCLRGYVILGEGCEVRAEVKNAILLDAIEGSEGKRIGTSMAHGLYIGDAIVGRGVNLGAGTKLANLRSDFQKIYPVGATLRNIPDKSGSTLELHPIGYKYCGVIGDWVSVGCGSVVGPGVAIGRLCSVYPNSVVTGYVPPGHEWRRQGEVEPILVRPADRFEGRL